MSNCADFERLMERMMAGDYEPRADGSAPRWVEAARQELQAHLEECNACGELFRFHEWLSKEAPRFEEPEAWELQAVRESVLSEIRRTERSASSAEEGAPWWMRPFLRPAAGTAQPQILRLRGSLVAAAAGVLLVAGVTLGRVALPGTAGARAGADQAPVGSPAGEGDFAAREDALRSLESAPYLFSNVSVQPAGQGKVALSFDMTRRVRLERAQDDPMVNEAIVYSLRGSGTLGDRLKAVSVAGGHVDPTVREALIQTMESDPSVAVRLKALETLGKSPADPQVQAAMLGVLSHEESVQMRLLAVEYLGSSQVQPELVRNALQGTQPDGAAAVLLRASERFGL